MTAIPYNSIARRHPLPLAEPATSSYLRRLRAPGISLFSLLLIALHANPASSALRTFHSPFSIFALLLSLLAAGFCHV
jgi:hypothetical protein